MNNSKGQFNNKDLEKYRKDELIDIIIWIKTISDKEIKNLKSNLEFIHNASELE